MFLSTDLERGAAEVEWGSQVRSYDFQPHTMANDNCMDVQIAMDGDLDVLIKAYLLQETGRGGEEA